jgi:hypothetical protein
LDGFRLSGPQISDIPFVAGALAMMLPDRATGMHRLDHDYVSGEHPHERGEEHFDPVNAWSLNDIRDHPDSFPMGNVIATLRDASEMRAFLPRLNHHIREMLGRENTEAAVQICKRVRMLIWDVLVDDEDTSALLTGTETATRQCDAEEIRPSAGEAVDPGGWQHCGGSLRRASH